MTLTRREANGAVATRMRRPNLRQRGIVDAESCHVFIEFNRIVPTFREKTDSRVVWSDEETTEKETRPDVPYEANSYSAEPPAK